MDLMLTLLGYLTLGAALGFFGGIFGIGGGIIAIPILILAGGMEQATAQGTALVMMAPNLLVAWWRYTRRNPEGLGREALAVAVVATAITWGAALLANRLDPQMLRILFCLFLGMLGLLQLPGRSDVPSPARLPRRLLPLVGLAGGGSMGLLGIGGGLVATPLLTGLFGLGQRAAQAISLALVTPASVAALAGYARHQSVDWPIGIALAVGGVGTVSAGVAVAHAFSERTLRRLFGLMLILTAAVLAIRA